ncbi:MAG: hypothetical protein IPK04_14945 [Bdellovibrionales bacterium]|nr:hypothetical protein [Bdellovibrionales bacterium]
MSSNKQNGKREEYNYFLRVLAFLAEQKISTAKQIDKYCFSMPRTRLSGRS